MPITKQAIKRARQAIGRRERNTHYESRMKSLMRTFFNLTKSNEAEKSVNKLPDVMKAIDLCAKKNIIHKNNAAHKKSRLSRALTAMGKEPAAKEKPAKK
jgi:small subunit ribosomal protein S20